MSKEIKKAMHIKNGDRVVVITGKDKGKTGNIDKVNTEKGKVIVKGVNLVTKAQKANPMAGIEGGLNKVEAMIDSSNVMVICSACEKATRIKYEIRNDKKVRVCKKCNESLDV